MAENNKDNQDNIYNNGQNRNIRNEDSIHNNDYPSNVVRLEPDIGLGNRTQQQEDRKRRNESNQSRREESSISFRHFLQNDIIPASSNAYPDLYSCSRQDRQNVDVSVVEPDSPDLPDFVQDHLAVEHMYFNDGSQSTINTQNLPDFASCVPRNTNNEMHIRLPSDEPSASASASLPFDLTTPANVAVNCGTVRNSDETKLPNTGGRLPDFLSDGHVLGHPNSRHRDLRIVTSENGGGSETFTERHNLIIMLRQENNRLRDELSVLQSVLMKKDDRIKELEDLVMALEISKQQMSSDANTQTVGKGTVEEEIATLKKELQVSKNEVLKLQKEKLDTFAELCQKNVSGYKPQENAHLALKVKEMTSASERLVRELLKIITNMQADINNDISNIPVSKSADGDADTSPSSATDQSTTSN